MADTTTIELKKTTHAKLKTVGKMGECFDDVINRLIKDSEEVDKYIKSYIKSKDGECVCEVVLGRAVLANHTFIGDTCDKCGISSPIVLKNDDSETVIEFRDGWVVR